MTDDGEDSGAGSFQPSPVGAKYSAGRKVKGLSAADANRLLPVAKKRPTEPDVLTSNQQAALGIELGLGFDGLGYPEVADSTNLIPRAPTDAEVLYSQFLSRIPICFYATVFEGTAPTLFWSDGGRIMKGQNRKDSEYQQILSDWWRAIHLVRNPSMCQLAVNEVCDLMLMSQGYDGIDYDISIPASRVHTGFFGAPRAIVANPKVEFDSTKGHRVIAGFGFSQSIYFHSLHLAGTVSASLYSPEILPRLDLTKQRS